MKIVFNILMVVLLLTCSSANAKGVLTANKVTQVGGFFLYADNWPNPNGCTRSNAIVLKNSDVNYDKAYSLLLAAYMSGKEISGYSDGCAEFDGQTYNTIRGFKYLTVQ